MTHILLPADEVNCKHPSRLSNSPARVSCLSCGNAKFLFMQLMGQLYQNDEIMPFAEKNRDLS